MINNSRGVVAPYTSEVEKLLSGELIETPKNNVKDKKHITFTADVREMADDAVIKIGHGYNGATRVWIEITKTQIAAYSYFSYLTPQNRTKLEPTDLGFEIKDYISVAIDVDVSGRGQGRNVIVETNGGMVKFDTISFTGCMGACYATAINCELENCKLNFVADGYGDPIWVFGDSYLSFPDPARWPTYLFRDGYVDNVMLSGYPGMKTETGLADFKIAIERGTPVFAVWCLGMNNGDGVGATEPNPVWLSTTEEFLAICKEKGITPILATIPTTPTVYNEEKNKWVRASGYRYIDFPRAVSDQTYHEELVGKVVDNTSSPSERINKTGYKWYDNMLCKDAVHPAIKGAEALYAQVLVDFPEIMNRF